MSYAVEIRYPDDWYMPSKEDAIEAREAVSKVGFDNLKLTL